MKALVGFLLGAASTVGVKWAIHHGGAGHCGHRHGELFHRCRCGCGKCRRRRLICHLFEHLGTTPGQEQVLRPAADEFAERMRERLHNLRGTAADIGRSVRGERFDEDLVRQVFSRHDQLIKEARDDLVNLLRRVHESLDQTQRDRLGRFLESARGWGGAGCHHHHHERHGCGCE